jgi:hypothetical protein
MRDLLTVLGILILELEAAVLGALTLILVAGGPPLLVQSLQRFLLVGATHPFRALLIAFGG